MPPTAGTESSCALIAGFEGFMEHAYQDQRGRWTVGFGFTGPDVGPTSTITREAALVRLVKRVGQCRHILEAMITAPLTDDQWDAVTSLAYNIGEGEFEHSTMRAAINAKHYAAAADEFPKWDHVNHKEDAGLLKRRMAERALFLKGLAQI